MTECIKKMMFKLGLLGWGTLLFGLEKGWLLEKDVADYALDYLMNNPGEANIHVVLLAGYTGTEKEVIRNELKTIAEKEATGTEAASDQWRLAFLVTLQNSTIEEDTKIDQLQSIYALFDYPEDMRGCCRYGPSQVAIDWGHASAEEIGLDPLIEMGKLIIQLKAKYDII